MTSWIQKGDTQDIDADHVQITLYDPEKKEEIKAMINCLSSGGTLLIRAGHPAPQSVTCSLRGKDFWWSLDPKAVIVKKEPPPPPPAKKKEMPPKGTCFPFWSKGVCLKDNCKWKHVYSPNITQS
jgi:hypothetical protein